MRLLATFVALVTFPLWGQMLTPEAIKANPRGSLDYAIASNDIDAARQALDAGASPNDEARGGGTVFGWAALEGRTEMVQMMLEKGADVTKTDLNGYTPLIAASKAGKPEVVKLLIAAQADVNVSSKKGYTAIILAGASGSPETVKLLIEAKADVNARSSTRGMTALIQSAMSCNAEMAKMLIDAGAKPEIVDDQGKNALSYAQDMLTYGQRPESQGVVDLLKDITPAAGASAPPPAPTEIDPTSQPEPNIAVPQIGSETTEGQ
jgi:ankyrin repeat protein